MYSLSKMKPMKCKRKDSENINISLYIFTSIGHDNQILSSINHINLSVDLEYNHIRLRYMDIS